MLLSVSNHNSISRGYVTLMDQHGDHPGLVCTFAKLLKSQAAAIIHSNVSEETLDQYVVEEQIGSNLVLVSSPEMLK